MALSENPTLKEIFDETERLNNLIVDRGGSRAITPKTANQVLSKGNYKGDITVLGDTDLIASNIRSGKNIFGVNGTLVEGKRIASGSAYPSNLLATKYYNYHNGVQVGFSNLLINLGWKAGTIVLQGTNPQDKNEKLVVYTSMQGVTSSSSVKYSSYYTEGGSSYEGYLYNLQANSIFNPSLGVYYMPISLSIGTIRWFAVEA